MQVSEFSEYREREREYIIYVDAKWYTLWYYANAEKREIGPRKKKNKEKSNP